MQPDQESRSRLELHSDALQSWREIAGYFKRSVRTVQRWERVSGLPVRRPRPGPRSPVLAFPGELDQWLHSLPTIATNVAAKNTYTRPWNLPL